MRAIKDNDKAFAQSVGAVIALLVTIIVVILVFWNITGNLSGMTEQTETFTGYTLPTGGDSSGGSNDTAQIINLSYVPYSTANGTISVVCYNSTGNTQTSPPVTISNRQVTIQSGSGTANPAGYDQINVTYTTMIESASTQTRTTATTTFALLPIIAIVAIGALLVGLVVAFGGRKE